MAKNISLLMELVKDNLNTNAIDAFPTGFVRRGTQFFGQSDSINFQRSSTFPKGQLRQAPGSKPSKSNFGRSGWVKKTVTIDIYYYGKERGKITIDGFTYIGQDLVSYMLNNIQDTLLNNVTEGYFLSEDAFGEADEPAPLVTGNQKYWFGVVPVTYYWYEQYGV